MAVLRDRQESDTIRHEAANLLRRSGYADLPSVLVACLQHPDEQERFRSWAVQHLFMVFAEQPQTDIVAVRTVIEPLLDDPQPAVRREALLSGHRLGAWPQAEVVATAAEWLDDPHAVDLAVRILRENNAREYLPQVRAILKDADASTPARIAALVTLGDWEDQHSQDAIAQLASESESQGNQRLHRSARMALERLHAAQGAQELPQPE